MASLFSSLFGARRRSKATQTERVRERRHEGFLRYANFRWAKISGGLCLLIIVSYALIDVTPRHNGGSWYGYTLGTLGAGLILWLTALGYRKRKMTSDYWSLKAWTSAHVYLGLSLMVIGTWHTGFQLGWNVHTLAWALMMLVILSGLYGIIVYATLPQALSNNRDEMTQMQMLEAIRAFDRQLHAAAQPLTPQDTAPVLKALDEDPFAGGIGARLSGRYPRCATAAALHALSQAGNEQPRGAREGGRAAHAETGGARTAAPASQDPRAARNLALCACAADLCADRGAVGAHHQRLLLLVRRGEGET